MVLIATVQPRYSTMDIPGGILSDKELEDTKLVFKKTLEKILTAYPLYKIPLDPPVVPISLLDTGKSIVEKIKAAKVHGNYLELAFDTGVCAKCSCTIQWAEKEKVDCIPVGRDESFVTPYEKSLCHPIFLPKNCSLRKIEEEDGVTYIALSLSREGRERESSEVCHKCGKSPGTEGCSEVGKEYRINLEDGKLVEIAVDHTNQIEEHRGLDQSGEASPSTRMKTEHNGGRMEGPSSPNQEVMAKARVKTVNRDERGLSEPEKQAGEGVEQDVGRRKHQDSRWEVRARGQAIPILLSKFQGGAYLRRWRKKWHIHPELKQLKMVGKVLVRWWCRNL